MSRIGKGKGRDDFVHFLRQVHRTETREVTEKVAMTEVQKGTPELSDTCPSEKAKGFLVQPSRKEVAKGESHVIIVRECTKFKVPGGCENKDRCAYKHTAKTC